MKKFIIETEGEPDFILRTLTTGEVLEAVNNLPSHLRHHHLYCFVATVHKWVRRGLLRVHQVAEHKQIHVYWDDIYDVEGNIIFRPPKPVRGPTFPDPKTRAAARQRARTKANRPLAQRPLSERFAHITSVGKKRKVVALPSENPLVKGKW